MQSKLVRQRSRGPVLPTPPLPLIELSPDDEWEEFITPTQTGFGYALPYLPSLDDPDAHSHAGRGCLAVSPEAPRRTQLLSEYMTNNEFFQSPRHGFGLETRLVYKRNKELESSACTHLTNASRSEEIIFAATFESGNLDRAYRVLGRRYAASHELLVLRSSSTGKGSMRVHITDSTLSSKSQPFPFFVDVDAEYDLYADTDVNTRGHIQWYFFRVTVPELLLSQTRDRGGLSMKVRFNIRNMLKRASLYNDGMLPVVYVESPAAMRCGWHHAGVNVCYFKNTDTYRHHRTGKVRNFYTLSFVYEFSVQGQSSSIGSSTANEPFVVYFAQCYPYTYTRLQRFILSMQKDPQRNCNFKRRVLCKTIAGNNCDLLTITDFSLDDEKSSENATKRRTAIVITARVHPGESNSSFIMHGVLDFLTGNSLEARFLRHHFVFKVVPMLNPDGVIHGNYRCSLAGTDLNRRWLNPSSDLHPTIFATKMMIASVSRVRAVSFYCDLHGHSRKKNIFLYGCRPFDSCSRTEATRVRLFPHILCKTSDCSRGGFYSFGDCTFSVNASKRGTGRVVVWDEMQVLHSFTLEASFFGVDTNTTRAQHSNSTKHLELDFSESSLRHFTPTDLQAAGFKFCHALLPFSQVLALQRVNVVNISLPPALPGIQTGLQGREQALSSLVHQQRSLYSNEPPTLPTCFSLNSGVVPAVAFASSSKVRLAPLQQVQVLLAKSKDIENSTSWIDPQRSHTSLIELVSADGIAEAENRVSFSLSEFDQLYAGEDMSMMSLLDHEDLIREIEAALPENFQDTPEEDGSVGSESEPSEDTEEEYEQEVRFKTPPKHVEISPYTTDEPAKLVVPVLARSRPPRVTRHLSEPRLLQTIVSKQSSETDIPSSVAIFSHSRLNSPSAVKAAFPLAPIRKDTTQRVALCQSIPQDRNREIAAMHLRAVQRRSKTKRNLRQHMFDEDVV